MASDFIRIYDKDLNLLREFSDFDHLLFTERAETIGEFEFETHETDVAYDECYIRCGRRPELSGKIEYRHSEDGVYTYKGYSLLAMLYDRFCVPTSSMADGYYHYKDAYAEDIIYDLVDKNAVNPEDAERKINHLRCRASRQRGGKMTLDVRFDRLTDAITSICEESGLSVRVDLLADEKVFEFVVYKGVDRTKLDDNRYLIEERFDRVDSTTFEWSSLATANYAIVLGQGDGAERTRVDVDRTDGAPRREIVVDARDIPDEELDDEGNAVEDYDVEESLRARGVEKLNELKQALSREFVAAGDDYNSRYSLGDWLLYRDAEMTQSGKVTEALHAWEDGEYTVSVTVGHTVATILSAIQTAGNDAIVERAGIDVGLNQAYFRCGALEADSAVIHGSLEAHDAHFTTLETDSAVIHGSLEAHDAHFTELETDNINVKNRLTAAEGSIDNLTSDNVTIKGTLETATAIIDNLDATYATIDSLNATNVSISGRLDATEAVIDNLDATYATIENLSAATGRITNLETENTTVKGRLTAAEAVIDDLDATYASIDTLQANYATITNLNAQKARIDTIESDYVQTTTLQADYATITNLNAVDAKVVNLTTRVGNIDTLVANKASITDLNAATARIGNLETGKASVGDLEALSTRTGTLEANVGNIGTLISGSTVSGSTQTIVLNAENCTMDTAFLKNLVVANVAAGDIFGNTISTNAFTVKSDDGGLQIADKTIQIKDSSRVRVQIGEDASEDYNLYLWDESGKLLWDAQGLTADAVTRPIIKDSMVSSTANISGSKLNIPSVVTKINDGTTRIESSRVNVNGQSLDVAFNTLETTVDGIESGGRNLILNAGTRQINAYAGATLTLTGDQSVSEWGTNSAFRATGTKGTSNLFATLPTGRSSASDPPATSISGQKYIHSIYVKNSGSDISIANNTLGGSETVASGVTKRVVLKGTGNGAYLQFTFSTTGSSIDFTYWHPQIEVGTAVSNWTCAPEDTESKISTHTTQISAVQGQISTLISNVDQLSETKADGSTVQTLSTNYSSLKQRVDGIDLSIGSLNTSLATKADSTTVQTISDNQSTLSDNLDGLTQRVTQTENTLTTKADNSTVQTLSTNYGSLSSTVSGLSTTVGTINSTVNDVIQSAITLFYASDSSGLPALPTAEVTSTATGTKAWTTAVPTYNSSYPYLYTCTQKKTVSGGVSWTKPVHTAYTNYMSGLSDTAKAGIAETVTLFYAKANSTAPAKPTSAVTTNSASTYNAWNRSLPTYSASTPYLYLCTQTKTNGGTYAWTNVTTGSYADFVSSLSAQQTSLTTTVNGISGKVTNLVSAVGANSDGTLTTSVVDQISEVRQTASSISQSVTDLQTSFDGLSVGGRNLILRSETQKLTAYSGATLTFTASQSVSEWNASNAYRVTGTKGTNNIFATLTTERSSSSNPTNTTVSGQTYTYSVFVKNAGGAIHVTNTLGQSVSIASGETKRVVINGTGDGSTNLQFNFYQDGNSVDLYYWHPKIETGNTVTDWTPAPEDTDSTISGLTSRISTAESKITPSAITLSVTESLSDGSGTLSAGSTFTLTKDACTIDGAKLIISGTGKSLEESLVTDVGGRNLILKSDTKQLSAYSGASLTHTTGRSVSAWGATTAIRVTGTKGSDNTFGTMGTGRSSTSDPPNVSVSGQAYSYSIYIKNNGDPLGITISNLGSGVTVASGVTKRITLKGTGNGTNYLQFAFSTSGSSINFTYWHPQIELGNVVSDWTCAPEDVAQSIQENGIGNWCYNNDKTIINGSKIATGTIDAKAIKANSITADEIKAGTITADKLATTVLAVGNISGMTEISNRITTAQNTANTTKTTLGTLTKVDSNVTYIDGGKIYTGSITANAISAGAVTAGKISTTSLSAISTNIGTVETGTIKDTSGKVEIKLDGDNSAVKIKAGSLQIIGDGTTKTGEQLLSQEIGGKNLLWGSRMFDSDYWTVPSVWTEGMFGGFRTLYISGTSGASTNVLYKTGTGADAITVYSGRTYTLSFWAKGSGKLQFFFTGVDSSGTQVNLVAKSETSQGVTNSSSTAGSALITLESSWKRYSITWTTSATATIGDTTTTYHSITPGRIFFRSYTDDTTATVYQMMFEEGNTATSWCENLNEHGGDGINLLDNSSFNRGDTSGWIIPTTSESAGTFSVNRRSATASYSIENRPYLSFYRTATGTSTGRPFLLNNSATDLIKSGFKAGDDFTLSGYIYIVGDASQAMTGTLQVFCRQYESDSSSTYAETGASVTYTTSAPRGRWMYFETTGKVQYTNGGKFNFYVSMSGTVGFLLSSVKIERGTKATKWSASENDVKHYSLVDWCVDNDTTVIDGSKIYTGSIEARSIKAGTITGDKLAANVLTVGNIDGMTDISNRITNAQEKANTAKQTADQGVKDAQDAQESIETAQNDLNALGDRVGEAEGLLDTARANVSSALETLARVTYNGKMTYIDGGNIYTGTVTAKQINVTELSALSANLGNITTGTISNPAQTITMDFTGGADDGIKVTSPGAETILHMDTDGTRVTNTAGTTVARFTSSGTETADLTADGTCMLSGLKVEKQSDGIWISYGG